MADEKSARYWKARAEALEAANRRLHERLFRLMAALPPEFLDLFDGETEGARRAPIGRPASRRGEPAPDAFGRRVGPRTPLGADRAAPRTTEPMPPAGHGRHPLLEPVGADRALPRDAEARRRTCPSVTVLAVDNGSTDETPARLQDLRLGPRRHASAEPRLRPREQRRHRRGRPGERRRPPEQRRRDPQAGWLDDAAARRPLGAGRRDRRLPTRLAGRAARSTPERTSFPTPSGASRSARGETRREPVRRDARRAGDRLRLRVLRREVLRRRRRPLRGVHVVLRGHGLLPPGAREAGFRIVCCGAVTLVHREHGSTSDDPRRLRPALPGESRRLPEKWAGGAARRATRTALHVAVDPELPDRLRHQLPGDSARPRRARRPDVSYEYVYGPGTPFPSPEPERSGDYRLDVIDAPIGRRGRLAVSVVYAQGDVFRKNRGRYRIGFTMLEVDGFPTANGCGRRTRWTRSGSPSAFNREGLLAVRRDEARPRDAPRRRHRPLPSRDPRPSRIRTATSSSCRTSSGASGRRRSFF